MTLCFINLNILGVIPLNAGDTHNLLNLLSFNYCAVLVLHDEQFFALGSDDADLLDQAKGWLLSNANLKALQYGPRQKNFTSYKVYF